MPLTLLLVVACSTSERAVVERVLTERAPQLEIPFRRTIAAAVVAAGGEHGVDPLLLLAVIEIESTYRVSARSDRGAVGLMQLRPGTARAVAERCGYTWRSEADLLRPELIMNVGDLIEGDSKDEAGLVAEWDSFDTRARRARARRRPRIWETTPCARPPPLR